MTTQFRRARSEEQRAERRRAVLDTAAAMLGEMPVADVSLNELSRRVGLAKSNVLRYFESREAVLLELLDAAWKDWLDDVEAGLPAAVDTGAPAAERVEQVADVLAAGLARRPVLCDLFGTQAAVLERNVSTRVVIDHKRAAIGNVDRLGAAIGAALPELSPADAAGAGAGVMLVAGAAWSHAQPPAAVLAAFESEPALAVLRVDYGLMLRELAGVIVAGVLARGTGQLLPAPGTDSASSTVTAAPSSARSAGSAGS